MNRLLRPHALLATSDAIWLVDEFQPVAARLDPVDGRLLGLIDWRELEPPVFPQRPVAADDTRLWVQWGERLVLVEASGARACRPGAPVPVLAVARRARLARRRTHLAGRAADGGYGPRSRDRGRRLRRRRLRGAAGAARPGTRHGRASRARAVVVRARPATRAPGTSPPSSAGTASTSPRAAGRCPARRRRSRGTPSAGSRSSVRCGATGTTGCPTSTSPWWGRGPTPRCRSPSAPLVPRWPTAPPHPAVRRAGSAGGSRALRHPPDGGPRDR